MQHYFIDKDHTESDFFEFNDNVLGLNLCFRSCDSIFSKNQIDDGTRALLNAISKKMTLQGHGLDIGCGLGVIAIALIKQFGVTFDMIDVNGTAVKLSKENLIKNNVQHSAKAYLTKIMESGGTLTIELYLSMSKADYDVAFGIAVVLLIIVFIINSLTKIVVRNRVKTD